jgi:rubrerythrin
MVTVEHIAAEAWAFRAGVEHAAAERFDRLATLVAAMDPQSPVLDALRSAAGDERRHFGLCLNLVHQLGGHVPDHWPSPERIAPAGLSQREAVLYELVAACCIAETQSMATLTTLVTSAQQGSEIAATLRAITRDEVRHAQIGWSHLARERRVLDVSFLAGLVPQMLSGSVDDTLFQPAPDPAFDDDGLLALGVLPHSMKRAVFVQALDRIVLPGFQLLGVSDTPARAWLAQRQRPGAHA